MQVLDIGAGRGETALHIAEQGACVWAVDYSPAALELAQELLRNAERDSRSRIGLMRANAKQLPFPANRFDLVYMLDLVEHLYPHELQQVLEDASRVLKPDGSIVIHTMPNTWYYRVGYPLYRWLMRVRGKPLPADPRDRWQFVRQMHVNEQNPIRLRRALLKAGLRADVWLETTRTYDDESNPFVRAGMSFVSRVAPLKYLFCSEIFAVATRDRDANRH
jgi:SAM-dependent methyltransferase